MGWQWRVHLYLSCLALCIYSIIESQFLETQMRNLISLIFFFKPSLISFERSTKMFGRGWLRHVWIQWSVNSISFDFQSGERDVRNLGTVIIIISIHIIYWGASTVTLFSYSIWSFGQSCEYTWIKGWSKTNLTNLLIVTFQIINQKCLSNHPRPWFHHPGWTSFTVRSQIGSPSTDLPASRPSATM